MMPTIDETILLVDSFFEGCVDKGGKPYIDHCIRVMKGLPADVSDDARHAALLHDILEDTPLLTADLTDAGYPDRVVDLVQLLTREHYVTYADYIKSIANSGDRELILIKLADNADNISIDRATALPEKYKKLLIRYADARAILMKGLLTTKNPPSS